MVSDSTESCVELGYAYITNSNFCKIIDNSLYAKLRIKSLDDIYKVDLGHILSKPEQALLAVYKEACEDPDAISKMYKKVPERVDTGKFVYEGGRAAYHSSLSCEVLHRDYFNIEIPVEIRHRGRKEIDRFRVFVKENIGLIDSDEPVFMRKLEAAFFLKNPPKQIRTPNSGVTKIENLDLEALEARIDQLLIDANDFRNSDGETRIKIAKLGYGTHRVEEAKLEGTALYTWHNTYKGGLKTLLKHYFRVKFNKNLVFKGSLLDQFGFKSCTYC
jgi:hypothetical protein